MLSLFHSISYLAKKEEEAFYRIPRQSIQARSQAFYRMLDCHTMPATYSPLCLSLQWPLSGAWMWMCCKGTLFQRHLCTWNHSQNIPGCGNINLEVEELCCKLTLLCRTRTCRSESAPLGSFWEAIAPLGSLNPKTQPLCISDLDNVYKLILTVTYKTTQHVIWIVSIVSQLC